MPQCKFVSDECGSKMLQDVLERSATNPVVPAEAFNLERLAAINSPDCSSCIHATSIPLRKARLALRTLQGTRTSIFGRLSTPSGFKNAELTHGMTELVTEGARRSS